MEKPGAKDIMGWERNWHEYEANYSLVCVRVMAKQGPQMFGARTIDEKIICSVFSFAGSTLLKNKNVKEHFLIGVQHQLKRLGYRSGLLSSRRGC